MKVGDRVQVEFTVTGVYGQWVTIQRGNQTFSIRVEDLKPPPPKPFRGRSPEAG